MDKWFIVYRNKCDKCCMNECEPEKNIECNCNNIEGVDCEDCEYKEVYIKNVNKKIRI